MIGVFDSGVGGLSALSPLAHLLPRADILYYADTAALPLGVKSEEEILERLLLALRFFEQAGVSGVLLACGTASSLLTQKCKASFAFPIVDIIAPTASALRALPKDTRTLFLGTPAAVRAARFPSLLARGAAPIFSLPCPALVSLAESGRASYRRVARVLSPARDLSPRAVVLGCTHFSLLSAEIAAVFPAAHIFDAAALGAAAAASRLSPSGEGTLRFRTTGDPAHFNERASRILSRTVRAEKLLP